MYEILKNIKGITFNEYRNSYLIPIGMEGFIMIGEDESISVEYRPATYTGTGKVFSNESFIITKKFNKGKCRQVFKVLRSVELTESQFNVLVQLCDLSKTHARMIKEKERKW